MQWSLFSSRRLVFCSSTSSLGTSSPASLVSLRRWWMRANASFPQKSYPTKQVKTRLQCGFVCRYISSFWYMKLLVAHLVQHQLLKDERLISWCFQSFASLHARKRWSFEIATGRAPAFEAEKNPDVSHSGITFGHVDALIHVIQKLSNIPSSIV